MALCPSGRHPPCPLFTLLLYLTVEELSNVPRSAVASGRSALLWTRQGRNMAKSFRKGFGTKGGASKYLFQAQIVGSRTARSTRPLGGRALDERLIIDMFTRLYRSSNAKLKQTPQPDVTTRVALNDESSAGCRASKRLIKFEHPVEFKLL
ncbi:uncharacterized protein J3D65DRAFT_605924 [Phyllosticta citribraziliensis]|uniref:Uncharacterized protein n=1 Tax=Phyllosticta citribraziliensis TaxID=989973 RepID=A0ABR1L9N1_9PEZI